MAVWVLAITSASSQKKKKREGHPSSHYRHFLWYICSAPIGQYTGTNLAAREAGKHGNIFFIPGNRVPSSKIRRKKRMDIRGYNNFCYSKQICFILKNGIVYSHLSNEKWKPLTKPHVLHFRIEVSFGV